MKLAHMDRKDFIKASSLIIAAEMLLPDMSCTTDKKTTIRNNWAGNYSYKAPNFYEPKSVEELQELVKKLGKQKALGSRHCFNDIADSPQSQISTRALNKVIALDKDKNTINIEGGIRYGDFAEELDKEGYALHNLASLPHITVAGACATATHGSGVTLGNLATAVAAMQIVSPGGEIVEIERRHPDFNGLIVGLGAIGIVTKVLLEIQKRFEVRQDVFQELPLASIEKHFDEIMSSGYSVSIVFPQR